MAGRKHAPSSFTRLAHSSSSAAVVRAFEERVEARHREIQALLSDNQRLAGIHVVLKQDLAATQEELSRLSAAATEFKAERHAEVREIYEKSMKIDAEVCAIAAMSAELYRVREDVQELAAARNELAEQLHAVESELAKARGEAQFVPAIKADIETMRHEIQRGRNAIEFQKKTHASNLEHRRTMDNNMISMDHEVEKLRAELANAERRARAAMTADAKPSPGYPANYDNPEMGHGGTTCHPDSYSMHQMQAVVDTHSPHEAGAPLHHPNDLQHTQVPRNLFNNSAYRLADI